MPKLGSDKYHDRLAAARVAKSLSLRETRASGGTQLINQKTDALDDNFALEHKYTDNSSFTLSHSLLLKLYRQANLAKIRIPLFVVTFNTIKDCPKDWVLMPLGDFEYIKRELDDKA